MVLVLEVPTESSWQVETHTLQRAGWGLHRPGGGVYGAAESSPSYQPEPVLQVF